MTKTEDNFWNRPLAFSYEWRDAIKIALISAFLVSAIMVFLQPFDTFLASFQLKSLKLAGYGLVVVLPILLLHPLQRWWYRKSQYRWHLIQESTVLLLLLGFFSLGGFIYHRLIFVSPLVLDFSRFWAFTQVLALPFVPFLLPVLVILRQRYGVIRTASAAPRAKLLRIEGDNSSDQLELAANRFIAVEAQENYVRIYYLDEVGQLQQELLRSTFRNVIRQLPMAQQVHRSYGVQLAFAKKLKGNSRKRSLEVEHLNFEVPVSRKYFETLRDQLQNRP